jgi:hypothetical protein
MWLLLSAAHAVCWVTYLAKLKPGLVITMILLRSDGNGMDMLLLLLVGGGMAKKARSGHFWPMRAEGSEDVSPHQTLEFIQNSNHIQNRELHLTY